MCRRPNLPLRLWPLCLVLALAMGRFPAFSQDTASPLYEKMLERVEDVVFIDSVRVTPDQLIAHLPLHPHCGRLTAADSLTLSLPDSCRAWGIAYTAEKGDRVFLSDSCGGQGSRLLFGHRMGDTWECRYPRLMDDTGHLVNPFPLSDGMSLYFASDAEGGLGGFDLYTTRYNALSEGFFPPERLPMPFNSTANDYFLCIDEQIGRGFLVSDRFQQGDTLVVYTFLPRDARRPLRGKTHEELVALAELRSISLTWNGLNADSIRREQDKAYRESLAFLSPEGLSDVPPTDSGPVVRIADGLYYRSASDFRSSEAEALYRQYCADFRQWEQVCAQLERERREYASAGPERREELRPVLLDREAQIPLLKQQMQAGLLQLRRTELLYLNQQP